MFPTLTWEPESCSIERLHQIDTDIIEHLFTLIKDESKSEQRLILLDYLEVRHKRILQWTDEIS